MRRLKDKSFNHCSGEIGKQLMGFNFLNMDSDPKTTGGSGTLSFLFICLCFVFLGLTLQSCFLKKIKVFLESV